jgi:hypothetical protein
MSAAPNKLERKTLSKEDFPNGESLVDFIDSLPNQEVINVALTETELQALVQESQQSFYASIQKENNNPTSSAHLRSEGEAKTVKFICLNDKGQAVSLEITLNKYFNPQFLNKKTHSILHVPKNEKNGPDLIAPITLEVKKRTYPMISREEY